MAESRRIPPPAAEHSQERLGRPRSRANAAAEQHSGEGAASAWETWRQREQGQLRPGGESDSAAAAGRPAA